MAVEREWTFEEMVLIQRHYPRGKTRACTPLLPGRTKQAIRNQAHKMRRVGRLADDLAMRAGGVREGDLPY